MFTSPDAAGPPRMFVCLLLTLVLIVAALGLQQTLPGSLLAVTVYKAHLMALGGWGGYWLDRALFPYDRPHEYLLAETVEDRLAPADPHTDTLPNGLATAEMVAGSSFGHAMLRRAIIVAACLVCVGLGA